MDGLINELQERQEQLAELREIRVFGEILPQELRAKAEQWFSVPVVDTYSAQEFGIIACQCPITNGLHVNDEFLIVELINDTGDVCRPGEVGRIIITDLRNYATPLIRYDIGDYAESGSAVCSCGRSSQVLTKILGRQRNLLRLPDGRKCWPRLGHLFREFEKHLAVKQFQVRQTKCDSLEVRVVAEQIATDMHANEFRTLMFESTGFWFNVEFKNIRDQLPRGNGGKFEDFISLNDVD